MIYSFIIDRLQETEDRLQAIEFQLLSVFFYCLNVVTTLISFAALIGFPILSGMTSWLFFTIHYGSTCIGVIFLKNFKIPRRILAGLRAGFPIAVTQWLMIIAIRELTDGMQPYKGWRQLRIADPFMTWAILIAQNSAGVPRSFKDALMPVEKLFCQKFKINFSKFNVNSHFYH